MLKLVRDMSKDIQIWCLLGSVCAIDENCKELDSASRPLRLARSNGHRKSGRPTKYYLFGTGSINAPIIEAYSDEDAVKQANERFFNA
jgi:hypothetical protein